MAKKVSIIIPCYNQAKFAVEAVESAINQTYPNIEIVCVNDASTDNSKDVLEELSKKYNNVTFINLETNSGPSHSRNIAIERATGEYILPLDADDKIRKDYVTKAVEVIENNPQIGIVYCEAELFGKKNGKWKLPDYDEKTFIFQNVIFCSALFRKSDWLRAGKYKDCMRKSWEDWDFWISIIELGLKPYKIPETMFFYRKHNNSSLIKNARIHELELWKNLVQNHTNLYINNEKCIERIFTSGNTYSKYHKYKKITNILLPIIIIETLLIVSFTIYKIFMG